MAGRMSTGAKVAVVSTVVIGGGAVAYLLISNAKGQRTSGGSISLAVTPHSLPDSGGSVTATGGTKNVADGASVTITVDGKVTATGPISGGKFSIKVPIAANTDKRHVTDRLAAHVTDASGVVVSSKDATVTIAANTKSSMARWGGPIGMRGAGLTQAANNEVLRRLFAT
jgi:hypothetical protein